jgi:CheY-like chemotaxis protein
MARILVIEDSPDSAFLIGSILGSAGHDVLLTTDRSEGRRALEQQEFDCVILDYYMDGMTAFEFIRFMGMNRYNMPVILCTAAHQPEHVAATLGIDHVLKKPFMPEKLMAMVEQACDEQRRQNFS